MIGSAEQKQLKTREALNNSDFVIPAEAGIQEFQSPAGCRAFAGMTLVRPYLTIVESVKQNGREPNTDANRTKSGKPTMAGNVEQSRQ